MGLAGAAVAVGAAGLAANVGSQLANSGGGGGPSPSGGFAGLGPNTGAGLGDLFAVQAPIGNELSSLGVPNRAFQPITGFNLSTPGFGFGLSDTGGTLTGSTSQTPNAFNQALPGLLSSFGDIASGAKQAGRDFLTNVLGEGASPLLSPLNQIEFARQKAVSDIEGNLGDRGVLGSSFATNSVANANATFGLASSEAARQLSEGIFSNQLQTLQAQGTAIQRQESLASAELGREIQQLQLEGEFGTRVSDALTQNSSTLAQLSARISQGRFAALTQGLGNLIPNAGSFVGGIGNAVGGLGNLLGLGGSSPSSSGEQPELGIVNNPSFGSLTPDQASAIQTSGTFDNTLGLDPFSGGGFGFSFGGGG